MKQRAKDLAVFGGPAAFAEPLHVGRPTIGNRARLLERINGVLDRRWLTNHGPLVAQFEREIERRLGVAHCIATCNGTVALELAIRACGLTGEVIIPAFTFVATAHALQWQGITPIFCDIDERTLTLDPARVEEAITPRTTGIIGVHLWGRACDVERLTPIARARGLSLIFDAAHAFGCTYQGRSIGQFGKAEVFSFHATKFVSTGEGGAVVTDDAELAHRIRLMKNFGFAGYDDVVYVGTNGKMDELSAALGLTSLESMEAFVAANRARYTAYRDELAGLPALRLIEAVEGEQSNYQYLIVEVDADELGLTRDELYAVLHAEQVLARRYFFPGCHRMEPYRSLVVPERWNLPVTERLAERVLALPTGAAVSADDIRQVCEILRCAAANAPAIHERLAASRLSMGTTP